MDLLQLIDQELEAAGYGELQEKRAYNFRMAQGHSLESTRHDLSVPEELEEPVANAEGKGREHKSSVAYRNPMVLAKKGSDGGLEKRLKGILEKRAAKKVGLERYSEVYQAFTGSDDINRIKLAGFAEGFGKTAFLSKLLSKLPSKMDIMRSVPEGALGIVQKLKGIGFAPQALGDAEAYLAGKALRSAASVGDLKAAQKLFESFPFTQISPEALEILKARAAFGQKLVGSPGSSYMSGFGAGAGLGDLAKNLLGLGAVGAGAGYMMSRPSQSTAPMVVQMGKGQFDE